MWNICSCVPTIYLIHLSDYIILVACLKHRKEFHCLLFICTNKRQMPGYNPQRRGMARTHPKIFVLFYVLFVLCHSVYCLCVNVYCTTATGWLPNCSLTNIYQIHTYIYYNIKLYTRVSFCDGSFYDDSLLRPLSIRTEHSWLVVHHCCNSSVLSLPSALLDLLLCACVSSFSILVQFF